MGEKWQREDHQTTGRLVSIWSKHDGSPDLGEGDVAAYLNALEADKAALLEALENSYTGMDYLAEFSESKAERIQAAEWLARYEGLLSRIRSEGAEVKAGE